MINLPLYYLAHRTAADMDRQGLRPNLAMRVTSGIAALATFGMVACVALAALDFLAWKTGLIG